MGGGGIYIAHTSLGQIVVYKYGYMSVQTYFGNVPVKIKNKNRKYNIFEYKSHQAKSLVKPVLIRPCNPNNSQTEEQLKYRFFSICL